MTEMAENRFMPAKTVEEEEKCVASAIPKSTGNIKTNVRLEFVRNTSIRVGKECKLGFLSPRCIGQKVQ